MYCSFIYFLFFIFVLFPFVFAALGAAAKSPTAGFPSFGGLGATAVQAPASPTIAAGGGDHHVAGDDYFSGKHFFCSTW